MTDTAVSVLVLAVAFLVNAVLLARELSRLIHEVAEIRHDLRFFYPEVRRARVFDEALPEEVEALKSEVTVPREWDVWSDSIEAELRGSPDSP